MTCSTTGFGHWVLFGSKVEAEYQRLHNLVYPEPIKQASKPTIYPDPDYGPTDRNRIGLRILDRGKSYGSVGFDMDKLAKTLVDMSDPQEFATVNSLLAEFRELNQSQGPNRS